jgi:hypothetical protein
MQYRDYNVGTSDTPHTCTPIGAGQREFPQSNRVGSRRRIEGRSGLGSLGPIFLILSSRNRNLPSGLSDLIHPSSHALLTVGVTGDMLIGGEG